MPFILVLYVTLCGKWHTIPKNKATLAPEMRQELLGYEVWTDGQKSNVSCGSSPRRLKERRW